MTLTAKWYLFGFGQAFAGGFIGAFVVGGMIAPDILAAPWRTVTAGLLLGLVGVGGWYAHLKNPYEPDTVSLKHLDDTSKASVREAFAANNLDSKGKTTT